MLLKVTVDGILGLLSTEDKDVDDTLGLLSTENDWMTLSVFLDVH